MSQIIKELSDINKIREELKRAYRKQDMTRQEYHDLDLKYLSQSANRISNMVTLVVSAAKHGRSVRTAYETHNLIGRNESIDTGDKEIEMIKCPDMNNTNITRSDCLSYSGETEHIDSCKTCESFIVNRHILLK